MEPESISLMFADFTIGVLCWHVFHVIIRLVSPDENRLGLCFIMLIFFSEWPSPYGSVLPSNAYVTDKVHMNGKQQTWFKAKQAHLPKCYTLLSLIKLLKKKRAMCILLLTLFVLKRRRYQYFSVAVGLKTRLD